MVDKTELGLDILSVRDLMGICIIEWCRFGYWKTGESWRCGHANPSYVDDSEDLSLVAMAEVTEGKIVREDRKYILGAACML